LYRFNFASPEKKRDAISIISVYDIQQASHQSCLPICHQALHLQPQVKVRIAILEAGGATDEEAGIGMFVS
jgi:hypothetical protein